MDAPARLEEAMDYLTHLIHAERIERYEREADASRLRSLVTPRRRWRLRSPIVRQPRTTTAATAPCH